MATCAILGQTLGTAVAMAVDSKTNIDSKPVAYTFQRKKCTEAEKKAVYSHDIKKWQVQRRRKLFKAKHL